MSYNVLTFQCFSWSRWFRSEIQIYHTYMLRNITNFPNTHVWIIVDFIHFPSEVKTYPSRQGDLTFLPLSSSPSVRAKLSSNIITKHWNIILKNAAILSKKISMCIYSWNTVYLYLYRKTVMFSMTFAKYFPFVIYSSVIKKI